MLLKTRMKAERSVLRGANGGRWLVFALLLALSPCGNAQQNDPWIGKRVVLQFGSVLKIGNQVVDNQQLQNRGRGGLRASFRVYRVEKVNGPWIWLKSETDGAPGWILAAEVIRFDQAIDYYTNQIRANPADANEYMSRGHVWDERKEYDLALADYNEAIRLDPGSELAWTSRGIAWRAKKEYDKAIADYTEAIRLDPSFASAFSNRGLAWYAKKEYDKAIADYTEAIRLDPSYAMAYYNRGSAWYAKKEYDKAIADETEAIRLDPSYAAAYINRGAAWSAKKDYDKAIADDTEAIRLDPSFVNAYIGRAAARLITRQSGVTEDAKKVLEIEESKGKLSIYAVIFGTFSARFAKDDGTAKEFLGPLAEKLDASIWPYPTIRYLRGDLDESGLLALAVDDDKRTDAHCFLGLDALGKGAPKAATEHFRWVRDHGNPRFIEYTIALAELDRAGDKTLAAREEPGRHESLPPVTTTPAPAPEPKKPDAPAKVAALLGTVLYVPTPELEKRFGNDSKPLADYINTLKQRTDAILANAEPTSAKGLLVAVGLKTNKRVKVWCQAVEGTMPQPLLRTLERELAEIEPVALKQGPAGFGLKFHMNGQPLAKFPEVPDRWSDAAQSSRSKTIIPPDDLFKILWPD